MTPALQQSARLCCGARTGYGEMANGNRERVSLPPVTPWVTHFANVSNNQINRPYPTFKSEKSSRKD